ncbi:MAG TPA: SDR family NAD(P)-dependent oxidoreductase [Polyangiaceae bacterium]|jgi:NAD(P)-dependent dehydrogenase (short-subunit alcohol dehydrogenase family)|nr:SDR family NAD(P)-dependent oxidoreductase [Polyangiaceae bacterium]
MNTYERTPQRPLPSGFTWQATARETLGGQRLDGAVAIVTGGYAGVGLETTRALAEAGATVVVPARTPDKARAALGSVPRVELEAMDLMAPASIDAFAARFLASRRPLTFLVNNAGIMAAPLLRDARGFDSQFATNHLGHFQLTARLWPAIVRGGALERGARVIALTSRGHMRSAVDFDDPRFDRRPYDKWMAYGQSKTANALFALALDARGAARGVRAFSVHPGGILTDLMRSMSEEERRAVIERVKTNTNLKTPEQGAATSVWCATSRALDGEGGVYCEDVDIAEPITVEGPRGVLPWARDPALAERLWQRSEEWAGVKLEA